MSASIQLEVQRSGRAPDVFLVEPGVLTIGRDEDCKLCLNHPEVESRHAILTIQRGDCSVEDLDSETGTLLNDERIRGRRVFKPGQSVRIGPFTLTVRPALSDATPPVEPPSVRPALIPPRAPEAHVPIPSPAPLAMPPNPVEPSVADIQTRRAIKQQIHRELVTRLDLKRLTATRIGREELRERAMTTIREIVKDVSSRLPPEIEPADLIKDVCDEALGLGPIEEFLADDEVTEIMVNGPFQIYLEKAGKLVRTDRVFMDDSSVLAIIERIVSPLGRRIDESQPYVDARLPDGSRVNAVIAPLSLVGPCLTVRKFSKTPLMDQDLIRFGTMNAAMAEFFRICVLLRKNIVISGGTGSGKTTLLNVIGNYLPATDRIVTIEDAAELKLKQVHIVRLEARPANIEGKGAITIRDLVRNALRMRPDRIVVGECRGGEALDMLQAMNTGHDGSLTTVHANSPRDVISRLETMVLMSGMDLPVRAIREQISSAVDMIIHISRSSDGTRKITKVTEIVGQEGDQITMQDIFEYVQRGVDANGKVQGAYKATGSVPTFIEQVQSRGLTINRAMFDPSTWAE